MTATEGIQMAVRAPTKLSPRQLKTLIVRVNERMTALKTNAKATSVKAELGETAVYDLLNGKNENPSLALIKSIARALNSSISYLIGESEHAEGDIQDRSIANVAIIGIAETGAFRQMADFDQDHPEKLPKIKVARHTRYGSARHFGLKIRGDSMNAAKPYPLVEGITVICVDFKDAGIEIENNKIYAVRRTLDGGQTYECTVKRAHVFRNRYELHPESTNPAHKPLIIPRGAGREADDAKEIDVIGLVYGVSFDDQI